MKTAKQIKKEAKDMFRDKYARYFEHKEFGYDDLMVEEDLRAELRTKNRRKR